MLSKIKSGRKTCQMLHRILNVRIVIYVEISFCWLYTFNRTYTRYFTLFIIIIIIIDNLFIYLFINVR